MSLGRRIEAARVSRRISLNELAKRAGVSSGYLSKLERDGYREPSVHKVYEIAKALDVCMETLMGEPKPFGPRVTLLDAQAELERRLNERTSREPIEAMTVEEYEEFAEGLGVPRGELDAAAVRAVAHLDGAGEVPPEWIAYAYYATGALAGVLRSR
jgi:transcriptional regulator with XRE-family HTH domain